MTDDPTGEDGTGDPSEDERAARLAALLSVDIGLPARPHTDGDDPASSFRAFPVPNAPAVSPDAQAPTAPADDAAITTTEDSTGDSPAESPAEPTAESPPAGSPARRGWRGVVWWGVLGLLVVSGLALVYAGTRIVRTSTEGEVVQPVREPTAPGFEALVDATPTLVLFHDTGGLLDAITVLTLPDPAGAGGGVVLIPDRTALELPIYDVAPVEIAYDLGSPQIATEAVSLLVGTAIAEHEVVDAARWEALVSPVAPLVIENPDELTDDDGEIRFPAGQIELEAADVGPYLEARVEDENDLARLFRHQLVWEAWLAAVGERGSLDAVPGEVDTGIGRFVRTLGAGTAAIETLPVEPAPAGSFGPDPAFLPRPGEIIEMLRRVVPFPVSPAPGLRARTRVLNGTTDTSRAVVVAPELPPAGVEVVVVGNASRLDVEETTVRFFGDDFEDEAGAIVEILGVGEVVEETRPSDVADITVTLGSDYE